MKTSYYGNKNLPPDVTAVRISRGAPRWKTNYRIAGKIPSLIPSSGLIGLELSDISGDNLTPNAASFLLITSPFLILIVLQSASIVNKMGVK
jgi:hypothetical protein